MLLLPVSCPGRVLSVHAILVPSFEHVQSLQSSLNVELGLQICLTVVVPELGSVTII